MENLFMGHEYGYWAELEERAQKLKVVDWLDEIAQLRAKVSFYESRIEEMDDFKKSRGN